MIINAFRDFADGLSRGLSLFFTERPDFASRSMTQDGKPRGR
jgi:hypothetical protein